MAVASYDKANPASVIRDVLIDPIADETEGYVYHEIFGLPVRPSGGIARGRAIDISSSGDGSGPGILAGALVKRHSRDLLSASAGQTSADAIGAARTVSTSFGTSTISFDVKQFTASTKENRSILAAGMSEDEELYLLRAAATGCHQKLERYCSDFFLALAAEKTAGTAETAGGWNEVDWQAALNGSALGSSNTTMEVFHSAIEALRLSGNAKVNSCIIPRQVMSKLRSDPQVLSRVVSGTSGQGFAMVNGVAVATIDFVKQVFKEHLGMEHVWVPDGVRDPSANTGDAQANEYIWKQGGGQRCWIGRAGEIDFSLRTGAAPRVLSGTGSFCAVYSRLMDVDIGPDQPTGAQSTLVTVDTEAQFIALDPKKGTILDNMY
tara:strand:- start:18014 stop:19150 length:1137 start_codon:yes stop_codon:yes gene_type:complete